MAAFSKMVRTRILWVSLVLLFLFAAEFDAAEPKRVLMLHAFNYTFPATRLIAEAVASGCRSAPDNRSRSMQSFSILPELHGEARELRTATFRARQV